MLIRSAPDICTQTLFNVNHLDQIGFLRDQTLHGCSQCKSMQGVQYQNRKPPYQPASPLRPQAVMALISDPIATTRKVHYKYLHVLWTRHMDPEFDTHAKFANPYKQHHDFIEITIFCLLNVKLKVKCYKISCFIILSFFIQRVFTFGKGRSEGNRNMKSLVSHLDVDV